MSLAARGWCGAWVILLASLLQAAEPVPADATDVRSAAMSARVDTLLAEGWAKAGVSPAAMVDDAEFLSRASLDLTGIIPTVSEVRAFLADQRPDKRARWI